jgi:hypothetical protein
MSKEDMLRVFAVMDKDGDRSIQKDELSQMLKGAGIEASDAIVDEMMAKADRDGDGSVDFDEFMKIDDPKTIRLWRKAIMAASMVSSFGAMGNELQLLEQGQRTNRSKAMKKMDVELLEANLDAHYANTTTMKRILSDYLRVADSGGGGGSMSKPLSKTDPGQFKKWRRARRWKAPQWLKLAPKISAESKVVHKLYDDVFEMYQGINDQLAWVRVKESVQLEELQKTWWKEAWKMVSSAVGSAIGPFVEMFKSGFKLIQKLWTKFKGKLTKKEEGCTKSAQQEEKASIRKNLGGAGEAAAKKNPEQALEGASASLDTLGEGAEEAEAAADVAAVQAKADGEKFEKAAQGGTPANESAATALGAEKSMDDAQDAACTSGKKKATSQLSGLMAKIKSSKQNGMPNIAVRGFGGVASVAGFGLEEVVDFRNKEIGYFSGAGIGIGSSSFGISASGFVGLGWKNSRIDWSLEEAYQVTVWIMGTIKGSFPIGSLPITIGATIGVGFKSDADDSAGTPYTMIEDGIKMVTFGIGFSVSAGSSAGISGGLTAGSDKYKFITSECSKDVSSFVGNIWRMSCGTCKENGVAGSQTAGLTAFRTAVHLVTFPIITDIIFTFLAYANHKKYPEPATCSDFSVQNRDNKTLFMVKTGQYINEASKQLELLRFHLARMQDNFDTLELEDKNLTQLAKVQTAFKKMENTICDKYPFSPGDTVNDAILNAGEIEKETPMPISKEQLMNMSTSELMELCANYTFQCSRENAFWRTKEWITDRLATAMANGQATRSHVWGSCTKSKQCHEPGTSCQWSEFEKRYRCMCARNSCYRMQSSGQHGCVKADGTSKKRAFKTLTNWIDRTELRIGLYAHQLKEFNAGKNSSEFQSRDKKLA